jgi:threonine dehydrogenase-like Zn-dependent dehydrogenase
MRERYRTPADALVPVGKELGLNAVLLEPATIVAKAWEDVDKIGHRSVWQPKTVVVTGAGPVGLLAALLGRQRGLEVHVVDRVTGGAKPRLVEAIGGHYHAGTVADAVAAPDVILECTGVPDLVFQSMSDIGLGGVVALLGVSAPGQQISVDGGQLNRDFVLGNKSVVGSVNANRSHYEVAVKALQDADPEWLASLVTRTVPLEQFAEALQHGPDDVKVAIQLASV